MIRADERALSLPGTLEEAAELHALTGQREDAAMSMYSKPKRSRRRGRKRRRHHDEWDRPLESDPYTGDHGDEERSFESAESPGEFGELEGSLFSQSGGEYREAREIAEERAELFLDAGKVGFVVVCLLIFLTPIGVLALIFWALKFGRRLFAVIVEPGLRERLVEEQVGRHIRANVGRERIEIADEHSRSLEVLSASIAHEIRNPITAAKSLLQQLRDDPGLVDKEEYAQVALGELERVERSISHLLRFGREEEMRKSPIQMCDVLDSALETFRERSERDGIEIRREFDCEGAFDGDADKLRRIVINLVGNAMDALGEGSIAQPMVEVSMGENLAGNLVWVRIRDNGQGIDSEARDKIFTPFYTQKHSGTGLGLAITKKLVEAHHGHIEVISEPGSGAEFVLSFPKEPRPGSGMPDRDGGEW